MKQPVQESKVKKFYKFLMDHDVIDFAIPASILLFLVFFFAYRVFVR